jgi:hypothetical protein
VAAKREEGVNGTRRVGRGPDAGNDGRAREKEKKKGVLVHGQHDRQHLTQIRRRLQEYPSLVQRLFNQFPLLIVQLEDGFLEVSDASVDELG